jgi:serine/threonine-protein kinase
MAVEVGQLFGNYRMVRLLGEGGFGEVYLVENPLIHRRAAVKVLHTELARDAELVRRFLNEARAASAIQHPNMPGWGRLGCGGWSVRRSHPSI